MASIWSTVSGILSSGVGATDGIASIFKAEAGDIASSIAKQGVLKNFKAAGFKATEDLGEIELVNAAGKTFRKTFNKGDAITADSYENMNRILEKAGVDTSTAWSNGRAGKLASSRYIDTDGLSGAAKTAAEDKNKVINNMLENFNNVRKDISGGYNTIDYSDLARNGTDAPDEVSRLRTLLNRGEKQKGLGLGNVAGGYFKDAELGSARVKGTAGAVAGGAIGVRFLSGGDLTHNPRGENDIAGIPFF